MKIRQQRLADEIRDLLATLFQGGQLSDPRLETVTITATKLTGDLQICKVYFRVYHPELEKEALKGLKSAAGLLRQRLAAVLEVRKVPSLQFIYDKSIEEGAKVEQLIQKIKSEDEN